MFRWLATCFLVVVLAAGGFYLLVGSPRPVDPTPSASAESPRPAAAKKVVAARGELHAAEPRPAAAPAAPPDRNEPAPGVPVGALPLIVIPEGRVTAVYKQEVPTQHEGQLLFIGAEITEEQSKKLPPDEVVKARVGSLWAQLAAGEKEKNHIPDTEIRRWRVMVARGEGEGATSSTEIREYRRLGEDEEINIHVGDGDVDAQRVQLLRELRYFRRLQEGDEVAEGQLLGMINPSLAVDDLFIKLAK